MASSTQPLGQSLFDFLNGKTGFDKLEAIRNGSLGREINRYVHAQLDHLNIGSLQQSIPDSIWGSPTWDRGQATSPPSSVMFNQNDHSNVDLVGGQCTHITATEDLQPGLGGIDDSLTNPSQANEPIFRSHRNA